MAPISNYQSSRMGNAFGAACLLAATLTSPAWSLSMNLTVNTTGGDGTFTSTNRWNFDQTCAGAFFDGTGPSVTTSGGTGSSGAVFAGGASASSNCAEYVVSLPTDFTADSFVCTYSVNDPFGEITYPTVSSVRLTGLIDLEGVLSCTLTASAPTPPSNAPEMPTVASIENTQAAIGRHLIAAGPTNRYFRNRFSRMPTQSLNASSQNFNVFQDFGSDADWNVWFDGFYLSEDFGDLDRTGQYGMLSFGVDRYVSDDTLLGLMLILDRYDTSDDDTGFDAEVDGWMTGPYFAHALRDALFVDGRVAFGRGYYDLTPDGIATGEFETERLSAGLRLSCLIGVGNWLFDTYGEVLYYRSESDAYTDSAAIAIPAVTYEDGRIKVGTRAYYSGFADEFSPFVGLDAQSQVFGDEGDIDSDFLGRVSTGFDYFLERDNGLVRLDVGYGGIGTEEYETIDGRVEVRFQF